MRCKLIKSKKTNFDFWVEMLIELKCFVNHPINRLVNVFFTIECVCQKGKVLMDCNDVKNSFMFSHFFINFFLQLSCLKDCYCVILKENVICKCYKTAI